MVLVLQITDDSPNLLNFLPAKLSRYTVLDSLFDHDYNGQLIPSISYENNVLRICNINTSYYYSTKLRYLAKTQWYKNWYVCIYVCSYEFTKLCAWPLATCDILQIRSQIDFNY